MIFDRYATFGASVPAAAHGSLRSSVEKPGTLEKTL
jgi:hypothetical protein